MKNKYMVIDAQGKLHSPARFAARRSCPAEFKMVIEREALGIPAPVQPGQPAYLALANKMGFRWEPASAVGFLQYNYKAQLIMRLVQDYARQLVNELGLPIYEVRGANFFDLDFPVVQAYAGLFGDRLFRQNMGKKELVMSYDASYPQFNLASQAVIKDAALPFAHFSIADCYRFEQSGECMLLYRGRRFFMPDLHPYFRDLDEAWAWYPKLEAKLLESVAMANRHYWNVVKVSSEDNFNRYQEHIKQIAQRSQQPLLVEIRRDGVDRYWIIDVDYSIVDQLQQVREIGCIQIDVGNAQRLGIVYRDKQGQKQHPVIIHSAIPGGLERFLYMLFDNFKESFAFWLHPVQLRLLPVNDQHVALAQELAKSYSNQLRIEIDDRAESISKKVKLAHQDLVPEILVIGDREKSDPKLVYRKFKELAKKNKGYPFVGLSWPKEVSKQIR